MVRRELAEEIAKNASLGYNDLSSSKEEDEVLRAVGALEHSLKDILKKDYPSRGGDATSGLHYDLHILKTLVEAAQRARPRQFAKEAVESLGIL